MNNHDIIWVFEEQFAREVALGSILSEPQPIWRTMIPGMFIFDFLKRLKRIRTVSARYLFACELAFNALARPAGLGSSLDDIAGELRRVAQRYGPVSNDPQKLQTDLKALVELLSGHYRAMLKAKGHTWTQLIADTYPDLDAYQKVIARQTAQEENIAARVVFDKIERLRLPVWRASEKAQLEQRRAKYAEMAFDV